ncbi:MAG: Ig-like domain repeat protein, partial [Catenulispora sp.]
GLTPGDHTIVAVYEGDVVYNVSSSAPVTQKVGRAPTSAALDAGVDPDGYYLVATIAGSAAGTFPGGTLRFEDATSNTVLRTVPVEAGAATIRLAAPLPVGHRLRAVYSGDDIFASSTSPMMPFIASTNAFSFAFNFAGDSIVSIFGADLADATVSAPSLPLPSSLGGVQVKIVDPAGVSRNASIYFVSAGQINIVMPGDVPTGPARLVVTNARGSYGVSILVSKAGPSLASGDGSGSGPAAAHLLRVHADGSQDPLIGFTGAVVPFGELTDSLYAILYGTGFRNGQTSTVCSLDGQRVTALYAGSHATYPGLDQVNIPIPGSWRGAGRFAVSCSVGGQTSNAVTFNLQ